MSERKISHVNCAIFSRVCLAKLHINRENLLPYEFVKGKVNCKQKSKSKMFSFELLGWPTVLTEKVMCT